MTGGMAKASTALFAGIASLKVQAVRAGNSISIRRVDAEENQGGLHSLQDSIVAGLSCGPCSQTLIL